MRIKHCIFPQALLLYSQFNIYSVIKRINGSLISVDIFNHGINVLIPVKNHLRK